MSKLKSIKDFFFKTKKRIITTSILAVMMVSLVGTCAIFSDHIEAQIYLTIAKWQGEPVIQQWEYKEATDFHAYRSTVTSITFLEEYDEESDTFKAKTSDVWDVSHARDESVMAYMVGNNVYICSNVGEPAKIIANPYSSHAFDDFTALTSVNNAGSLNTEHAITFGRMFRNNRLMATLDVSSWNTSKITDINEMFYNCQSLTDLDVATKEVVLNKGTADETSYTAWDTSKVENMHLTFYYCYGLTSLDVSKWDTSSADDMSGTFMYCKNLSDLDIEPKVVSDFGAPYIAWNTGNVETMKQLFMYCTSLQDIHVANWNTSSVENMSEMFRNCEAITTVDVTTKTATVGSDTYMAWDTGKVNTINQMFAYAKKLEDLDVSKWDTSSLQDASLAFLDCAVLEDVGGIATQTVTVGSDTYTAWNTRKLENTERMFGRCFVLTGIDISDWDMSKVTNNIGMFISCRAIESLVLPASLSVINNDFAYDCTHLTSIEFLHSADDDIEFPDPGPQSSAAAMDGGAFYVSSYLETYFDFNGNADAKGYDWITDNRMKVPVLQAQDAWFTQGGTTITKDLITRIELVDTYSAKGKTIVDQWDASIYSTGEDDNYGNITAYLEDDGSGNNTYKLTIAGNGYGLIFANEDSSSAFYEFENTTAISNMDLLDTRNVTTMESMFDGCYLLADLDVHSFNTSNVTNMGYMFNSCYSLESMDFSTQPDVPYKRGDGTYTAWDTSNLEYAYFFLSMYSAPFEVATYDLTSVDMTGWNTSSLIAPDRMFMCNYNLTEIKGIEDWDMSAATTLEFMFYGCSSLETLDVSEWVTTNVESTRGLFNSCAQLQSIDISEWDMSNVTNTREMFIYCESLTELTLPATLSEFGKQFAARCPKLTTIIFLQPADMEITFENSPGIFLVFDNGDDENPVTYSKTNPLRTKVVTDNADVLAYDWANDHRGYVITIEDATGGTLTASPTVAINGVTVDLTISPSKGYKYEGSVMTYTDEDGNEQTVELGKDESFTMPVGDVTITPSWKDATPILAANTSWYYQDPTDGVTRPGRATVTSITFAEKGYTPTATVADTWDASENLEETITAYLEDDGSGNGTYKLTLVDVGGYGKIFANKDSQSAFGKSSSSASAGYNDYFASLTSLKNVSFLDTSKVESMMYMFYYCTTLPELDITTWNTSCVTNMSYMFSNCVNLSTLNLLTQVVTVGDKTYTSWDTSNVENFESTFYYCSGLTELLIGNWNTSKAKSIGTSTFDRAGMFAYCEKLTSLDIATKEVSVGNSNYIAWDTSNITNMQSAFYGCKKLTSLPIGNWDTSSLQSLYWTFYNCLSLTELDVATKVVAVGEGTDLETTYIAWDTPSLYTCKGTFYNCSKLTSLEVSNWNTSALSEAREMFSRCSSLTELDVATKVVTVGEGTDLETTYIAWDTSRVSTLKETFYRCSKLTTIRCGNWNTSLVSSLDNTFASCSSLAELDVATKVVTVGEGTDLETTYIAWDTKSVTNLYRTFYNCESVPVLDVSSWTTTRVKDFTQTFMLCRSITSLDLSNWDTSAVTSSAKLKQFSAECHKLTDIKLGEKFGQEGMIPEAGQLNGMFYVGDPYNADNKLMTNLTGANAVMAATAYAWGTDNRGFPPPEPILAKQQTWLTQDPTDGVTRPARSSVTSITFTEAGYTPDANALVDTWDASQDMVGTVTAYLEDDGLTDAEGNDAGTYKVTLVDTNDYGAIFANKDSSNAFNWFTALTALNNANFLDTRDVETMNAMFFYDIKLTSLDVSEWDTQKVTDMAKVFDNCQAMTSLDVSTEEVTKNGRTYDSWDTGSATTMSNMFSATKVPTLDVSHFDTRNVRSMGGMFKSCTSTQSLNISTKKIELNGDTFDTWHTLAVSDMATMFYYCMSLTNLDVRHFDTRSVQSFDATFALCKGLTSLDITPKNVTLNNNNFDSWDTKSATKMTYMFQALENITSLNVSHLDTDKVGNMWYMFSECTKLESLDLTPKATTLNNRTFDSWDTGSCTDMTGMFNECKGLTSLTVKHLDTSKVKNMSSMFKYVQSLESLDLTPTRVTIGSSGSSYPRTYTSWNTSASANMANMFYYMRELTALDISHFDTTAITSTANLKWFAAANINLTDITLGEKFGQDGMIPAAGYSSGMFYVGSPYSSTNKLMTNLTGANAVMAATAYDWGDDNRGFPPPEPILAEDVNWYSQDPTAGVTRPAVNKVTSITITNKGYVPSGTQVDTWDASENMEGTITAYLEDDGSGTTYKLTLVDVNGYGKIFANRSSGTFNGFSVVTNINNLNYLDTSRVQDMSKMFYNCKKLTSIAGVENWDISNVDNMAYMFYYCQSLQEVNALSKWNTNNVTDMSYLFQGCSALFDITGLSNWNTSRVTTMKYSFSNCKTLKNIDALYNWKTTQVNSMLRMFNGCSALQNIDGAASWTTSSLEDMSYMFYQCKAMVNIDGASSWNTSNVSQMSNMFYECTALKNINGASNWITKSNKSFNDMFNGCSSLSDITGASKWTFTSSTSTVSSGGFVNMFKKCTSLTNIDALSNWDTSTIKNWTSMFEACSNLANINGASNWKFSSTPILDSMFNGCTKLADISGAANWDTSSVTDMGEMFRSCKALTSLDSLASWDTSSVKFMNQMFQGCTGLLNGNGVKNWITESVLQMNSMFSSCSALTSLNVQGWSTANVTNMNAFAIDCTHLSEITVGENFATNTLPTAGSSTGLFYYSSSKPLSIIGTASANLKAYNFAADNRTVTWVESLMELNVNNGELSAASLLE